MKVIGLFVWGVAAVVTGYLLFYVSYRVEELETKLSQINEQILREQETIHILEAEWSYLNRPDRLQKLSDNVLPELQPIDAAQFTSLRRLPRRPDPDGDGKPYNPITPYGPKAPRRATTVSYPEGATQ